MHPLPALSQTHKAVRDLARYTTLRTAVLVGGDAMEVQFAELATNPDALVATPGRLLHHLQEVRRCIMCMQHA